MTPCPLLREPLIDSAAHLQHIFSRLLLAEKLDVHPVHLALFAIAGKKICTESVPPHSISVSLDKKFDTLPGGAAGLLADPAFLSCVRGIIHVGTNLEKSRTVVRVKVLAVDVKKKRISLTMKFRE